MPNFLSLLDPQSATILTTWDAVWPMPSSKQHRDKPSLLDLLRGLVGAPSTRIRLSQSKVARLGARPVKNAETASPSRAKASFGQRGRSTSHR